jgi:hypothetical protein
MGEYPEKNPPASYPRTTRKGCGKDVVGEIPHLGVTKSIMLRMPDSFPRTTRKGYRKDITARNFSVIPTSKAVVRDRMKTLLHQTSPKMIKLHQRPPDSSPRTTQKSYGGDAQGRIHPNPFLEQPERVMARIQWEETSRLGVSEGIRTRIRPIPFLKQPERAMERIQRVETSRLGVSEG